jgi:serine/threonine-protein kinase RsbW
MSAWTWTLAQSIPSRTEAAAEHVDTLLVLLRKDEWEPHDVFGIHMAVEEALVNAIKHGNKESPEKFVHVLLCGRADRLRVEIRDEGCGFDAACLPDPTSDLLLDQPNGRGVMLIRWFMTNVQYLDGGNRLVMEKERTE